MKKIESGTDKFTIEVSNFKPKDFNLRDDFEKIIENNKKNIIIIFYQIIIFLCLLMQNMLMKKIIIL